LRLFEELCVRASGALGTGRRLDLGLLAEGLIFYGKVHLVADRGVLTELIHSIGPELTLRLVDESRFEIHYCNNFSAIYTEDDGTPRARHLITVAEMPHTAVDRLAPELFIEATGKSGRGRRLASRFLDRVHRVTLDESIATSAAEDATDSEYVNSVVATVLETLAPEFPLLDDWRFQLDRISDNRIRIQTNLDLAMATAVFQRHHHTDIAITQSLLLGFLVAVHEDLAFAGRFGSDIASTTLTSRLLRLKWASLEKTRVASEHQLASFQDFVFNQSRGIADAVRRGGVTFSEVLDVVARSGRFRHWLAGQPPDSDLVRKYFEACTKETWIERLPASAARWAIITASGSSLGAAVAGPGGIVLGAAVGAADFVVERVRQGWKPSHFVEGDLKGLLR
jgi:hypothetical protein